MALDDEGRCTRASFGIDGAGMVPLAFAHIAARLAGTQLNEATITSAAHEAAATVEFSSDLHAGADYRRHLAETLAARVLREANAQAMMRHE